MVDYLICPGEGFGCPVELDGTNGVHPRVGGRRKKVACIY